MTTDPKAKVSGYALKDPKGEVSADDERQSAPRSAADC